MNAVVMAWWEYNGKPSVFNNRGTAKILRRVIDSTRLIKNKKPSTGDYDTSSSSEDDILEGGEDIVEGGEDILEGGEDCGKNKEQVEDCGRQATIVLLPIADDDWPETVDMYDSV